MTISAKLTTVNSALADIKSAIIGKGQTPTGNITTYATAIGNISGGGSGGETDYATVLTIENLMKGTSYVQADVEAEACDEIILIIIFYMVQQILNKGVYKWPI